MRFYCSTNEPGNRQHFIQGDGRWRQEVAEPVKACRIALELIEEAKQLRKMAGEGTVAREFNQFRLKVVVVEGEFRRAQGTQRWIGVLPTKASRIAAFARQDEVWVDNEVAASIRPYLRTLAAECDYDHGNGAAFWVPLKGLGDTAISIQFLRKKGAPVPLTRDELRKSWQMPWPHVMGPFEADYRSNPEEWFCAGPSGGDRKVGGDPWGHHRRESGHLPIDVIERRHDGSRRILSTITERPERAVR